MMGRWPKKKKKSVVVGEEGETGGIQCLFDGNRRQRARRWWARAGWQVLGSHGGLVVEEGGHGNGGSGSGGGGGGGGGASGSDK